MANITKTTYEVEEVHGLEITRVEVEPSEGGGRLRISISLKDRLSRTISAKELGAKLLTGDAVIYQKRLIEQREVKPGEMTPEKEGRKGRTVKVNVTDR